MGACPSLEKKAQIKERNERKMSKSQSTSGRSHQNLLLGALLARFSHNRIPLSRLRSAPLRASGRFSTRLGPSSGRANLHQKGSHHAAHLAGSDPLSSSFPGTEEHLRKMPRENQLVHGGGNDQTPPFELLWGSQTRLRPGEVLLEKAIGVLMRKASAIGRGDLGERQLVGTYPDKPTLAGIAFGLVCSQAQHTKDRHLDLPRLPEMQMMPGLHLDGLAALVRASELGIRLAPGLGTTPLEHVPIFAGSPPFPRR